MPNFPLDAGTRILLPGTTAQARPELAGVVLEDQLRSFTAPSVSGTLQDRVVRSSSDGTLAFYHCIYNLSGGSIDQAIVLRNWIPAGITAREIFTDFRLDGLGEVVPYTMYFDGSQLFFEFSAGSPPPPAVTPTASSRFMFIIVPGVTEYQTDGLVTISATTFGDIPNCFRPVIR